MADFNTLLGLRRQLTQPPASALPTSAEIEAENEAVARRQRQELARTSPFQAGLQQGLTGLQSSGAGIAGLARGAVGDDAGAQRSLRRSQELAAEAEDYVNPEAATLQEAASNGQLGSYALRTLGSFTPDIVATVAPAIATGGASALVSGGLRRAAARAVAREVGERAATREAAGALAPRAAGRAFAESPAGQRVADAYEAFAPKSRAAEIGQHAGAVAGGTLVSGGQAAANVDPNATGEALREQSTKALSGAAGMGVLQAVPGLALMHRYGVGQAAEEALAKRLSAPLWKRLVREGAEQGAIGGGIAPATVAANKVLHNWITGSDDPVVSYDALGEYLDAVAAGALGGAVFGAPAGLRGSMPALGGARARMTRMAADVARRQRASARPRPGEEVQADGSPIRQAYDSALEGLQHDRDVDDIFKGVSPYEITDTNGTLTIGTSENVPLAKFFNPARARSIGENAKTLGLNPENKTQHMVASLLPVDQLLDRSVDHGPEVKATAKAVHKGYSELTGAEKNHVASFLGRLDPEPRKTLMRTLMTLDGLNPEDRPRLTLATNRREGAVAAEARSAETTADSDTGLAGRLTERDEPLTGSLNYVPENVWTEARYSGPADRRGSPAHENVQMIETSRAGKARSVDLNLKRAASALAKTAEGAAMLSEAKNRKVAAVLGVATEAAARGTPIDPASITPGKRVFPDREGESGRLSAAEARAIREGMQGKGNLTPKAKAASEALRAKTGAEPGGRLGSMLAAEEQAAGKTRSAPNEGFAGGTRVREAQGTRNPGDEDAILGPRAHRGVGTGETQTTPASGADERAALDRAFADDMKKLQPRVDAAKTPEAKRAVFAEIKARRAKLRADREALVRNTAGSGREIGAGSEPASRGVHRAQEITRVDDAAEALGLTAASGDEGQAIRRGIKGRGDDSPERLAGLYRAAKDKKHSPARTALLGAVRRLADGDEALTARLDKIDGREAAAGGISSPADLARRKQVADTNAARGKAGRPPVTEGAGNRKAAAAKETLQHDREPLARSDDTPATVRESIEAAKKDPAYKALFKAISDLNKGRTTEKTLGKVQALADRLADSFGVPRFEVKFHAAGDTVLLGGDVQHVIGLGARHTVGGKTTIYLRGDLKAHERTSVLMHEFGHHLQDHLFNGLAKDNPTRLAIEKAFDEWVASHGTDATAASLRNSRAPFFRSSINDRLGRGENDTPITKLSARDIEYLTSFDEFFADMTARALEQHEGVQGLVGQFFAKVAHALRLVYSLMAGHDPRLTDTPAAFREFVRTSFMAGSDRPPEEAHVRPTAEGIEVTTGAEAPNDAGVTPPGSPPPPGRPPGGAHGGAGSSPADISSLLSPADRGLVERLVTRRDTFRKILEAFPHLAERLSQYDTQMETAVNAGYALWAAGKLDLAGEKGVLGAMRRFGDGLASAFGMKSRQQLGQRLFQDLRAGRVDQRHDIRTITNREAVAGLKTRAAKAAAEKRNADALALRTALKARQAMNYALRVRDQHLKPLSDRVLTSMDERLRASNVPALRRLATKVHLQTGEQGAEAVTAAMHRIRAQHWNRYGGIREGLSKRDEAKLLHALRTRTTLKGPLEVKRRQLQTLLEDLWRMQGAADAPRMGHIDNYWPVHVDPARVQAREADFRALLSDPKLRNGMRSYMAKMFQSQGLPVKTARAKAHLMQQPEMIDIFYRMAANEPEMSAGGISFTDGSVASPGGSEFRPRVSQFIYESGDQTLIDAFAKFQSTSLDATMIPYINRAVRRAEFHKRFTELEEVTDGEFERVSTLEPIFRQARAQGATDADIQLARDYVDAAFGVLGTEPHPALKRVLGAVDGLIGTKLADANSKSWRKISNAVIAYQNVRVLGLGLFGNLIDPLGVWVRTSSARDAWSGYREAARTVFKKADASYLREQAEALGIAERLTLTDALSYLYGGDGDYGSMSNVINRAVFKYNGMELITRFSRTAALASGHRFLLRHARGGSEHSARYLAELNLKPDQIQEDPQHPGMVKLTPEVEKALFRFVDESVLRPAPTQRPGWQNDPHFAMAAQYKGYLYSFYNTIVARMVHEAKHGNVGGLTPIVGYIGVTMAAELAREMVQYGAAGNPNRKDWGAEDYLAYSLDRSGMFGPKASFYGDAGRELRHSSVPVPYESLTGPTTQQFDDLMETALGRRSVRSTTLQALPGQAIYRGWFRNDTAPSAESKGTTT